MVKEVTIILKSNSSDISKVSEALRIAVAMIGMDVMPNVIFCCDGVYCLLKGGKKGYDDHLRAVADLVGVRVLSDSLEGKGLDLSDLKELLKVQIISMKEASQTIFKSSIVFAL